MQLAMQALTFMKSSIFIFFVFNNSYYMNLSSFDLKLGFPHISVLYYIFDVILRRVLCLLLRSILGQYFEYKMSEKM